jgi:hypothetical protein
VLLGWEQVRADVEGQELEVPVRPITRITESSEEPFKVIDAVEGTRGI